MKKLLNTIRKNTKDKPLSKQTSPTTSQSTPVVSAGNPCPFLRGLVGAGMIDNGEVPIPRLLDAIETMAATRDEGTPNLSKNALRAVAATANGFAPSQIAHNLRHGVNLDTLRQGPFYKHGVHSRTLTENSQVDHDQLARLASFGSTKTDQDGNVELGLNDKEISRLLRDNFLRGAYAGHHRSPVQIPIMKAEYPLLLHVMGKQGKKERYLSVSELSALLIDHKFPERMMSKLTDKPDQTCPHQK